MAEALEGRALLSLAASQLLGSGSSITNRDPAYETTSVELDGNGNTVVGGSFYGTVDLDPTRSYPDNRDILTSTGERDAFVAKFNPTGEVLWSRGVGGIFDSNNKPGDDRVAGIAIDGYGDVYASGFISGNVPFGNGISINTATRADIFVWKLDSASGASIYANHAVGPANLVNQALDVAVTSSGDAFVSGFIVGATKFGDRTVTPSGQRQGVLARLDTVGNFLWATTYDTGAANRNFFERITLDKDGNILATGGVITATNGGGDIIINKYNGVNGSLIWNRTIGGPGYDAGGDVTTDPNTGDVYAVGRFIGPVDFNPGATTPGDTPNAPISATSFYALKLSAAGNYQWVRDLGARNGNVAGTTGGVGRPSVALDPLGRVVAAVAFQGRAVVVPGLVFGPGPDKIPGTPDDIIGTGGIIFDSQANSIDTMLVRLDAATSKVIEARRAGGGGIDVPTGLATYPGQPVVLVGNFTNAGESGRFSTAGLSLSLPGNIPLGGDSIYISRFSERYAAAQSPTDFDGDGLGDYVVYDPMRSDIYLKLANKPANRRIFGPGAAFTGKQGRPNAVAPQAVVGDFDGDGMADIAVFRPDTSQFYTLYSDILNVLSPPTNPNQPPATLTSAQPFFFGPGGLFTGARFNPIPLAGDIDGDGRDDLIVYEPMDSKFYVLPSNPGSSAEAIQFGPGISNSATVPPVPLSADVNGDNKDDLIVYRPDTGMFYVRLSGATLAQNAGTESFSFGPVTTGNRFRATPFAGDFNGDNKAEFGVYDPMQSRIYLRGTSVYVNGSAQDDIQFGPAPGSQTPAAPTLGVSDLNGDGRDDLIVYDPMTSQSFTIINSPGGGTSAVTFGPAFNPTRNLHPPISPLSPSIAALSPHFRPAAFAARGTVNFIPPPPAEAVVTPLELTPSAASRKRAGSFRLTTID